MKSNGKIMRSGKACFFISALLMLMLFSGCVNYYMDQLTKAKDSKSERDAMYGIKFWDGGYNYYICDKNGNKSPGDGWRMYYSFLPEYSYINIRSSITGKEIQHKLVDPDKNGDLMFLGR